MTGLERIKARFAALKKEGRGGLVTYITAGDPSIDQSTAILNALPDVGVDIVELGLPFSDPMADGPAIQEASTRALEAGTKTKDVLKMATDFRAKHPDTPLILMGYYNPIYVYGIEAFAKDAATAGADGMIIVDLPPEESRPLQEELAKNGMALIFLTTPVTDEARLATVLEQASGFLYYVSITGVTGTASATEDSVKNAVAAIRAQTDLPVVVGFGIKTPEQAQKIAALSDAAVVGSAIVNTIKANADKPDVIEKTLDCAESFAKAVR